MARFCWVILQEDDHARSGKKPWIDLKTPKQIATCPKSKNFTIWVKFWVIFFTIWVLSFRREGSLFKGQPSMLPHKHQYFPLRIGSNWFPVGKFQIFKALSTDEFSELEGRIRRKWRQSSILSNAHTHDIVFRFSVQLSPARKYRLGGSEQFPRSECAGMFSNVSR